MTSSINTGPINISYPVPGVNNNSQGFRDNFNSIKSNLETAASEITELQNSAILKRALSGSVLDNDMANGLIKNAQTLGFRASTYNLGSNLSGTVNIDLTLGDVHYGVQTADINLTFSKWAPDRTMSSVQLILDVTPGLKINLPATVTVAIDTIEGMTGSIITVPANVTRLHFQFNSIDCGTTVEIVALDRPRKTTQLQSRIPTLTNFIKTGTITVDTSSPSIVGVGTLFTTELVVGRVITDSADTIIGTILSITSDTIATLSTNAAVNVTASTYKSRTPVGTPGDVEGDIMTDGVYVYICSAAYDGTTAIWKRTAVTAY